MTNETKTENKEENEETIETGWVINHKDPRTHTFKFPPVPLKQNGKLVKRFNPKTQRDEVQTKPGPIINILPGINFLSVNELNWIGGNQGVSEAFEDRLDLGIFEHVCDADTFGDVPEKYRIMILSNTYDLDLLEEWKQSYGAELTTEEMKLLDLQILRITDPRKYQQEENKNNLNKQIKKTKQRSRKRASDLKHFEAS